ncbi:MAG: hypothetical protein KGL19_13350 [Bacteroidota bacterium]|nr:hypothetical protein [Bacteroidota bacterium]
MKNYLLLFISLCYFQTIKAQQTNTIINPQTDTTDLVYNPQVQATYPGGIKKLNKFLQENIDSSVYLQFYQAQTKRKTGILMLASVRIESDADLIIDKDGKIYNIKMSKGYINWPKFIFLKNEIIKVLLLSQPWKPALLNNASVKSKQTVKLKFTLFFTRDFRRQYFAKHPE